MNGNVPPPKPKREFQKAQATQQKRKADTRKSIAEREREIKRAQTKIQNQRSKIRAAKAVESKLAGESRDTIITGEDLAQVPPSLRETVEQEADVIFKPNPGPQMRFLASSVREVLYGGAAGGGKSYAMLADPLRYCGHPEFRGIIFRRTNDELRELIAKSKSLYPRAYPGAKWGKQESQWTFPSGATIWITYLDRDEDVDRYHGQAFQYVGFDELTHWPTPFPWEYMRSRLRTTAPDLPLFMRATTNPGGRGAWWVRKMFIDANEWGVPFDARDIETDKRLTFPDTKTDGTPHPRAGEALFQRLFIPARLTDNPYLTKDEEYEANLLAMPESQRRMLLDGDWDVVEGAAFPEFRRNIHAYDPAEVDLSPEWTRFRACDWGYKQPACCLWFAIDYDDNLWVYRELYVKGVLAEEFADMILSVEEAAGERIRYGVLDSSVWARRGENSPSVAETMIKRGVHWRPSDRSPGSRVAGKNLIHSYLRTHDITGDPRLRVSNACPNLIRTLPSLPVDKSNPEDVDTDAEDHAYDALRYGIASRPKNPLFGALWDNRAPSRASYAPPADATFGY